MAKGIVTSINADGLCLITPDHHDEPVHFWADWTGTLFPGDRVTFVVRTSEHGRTAERVRPDHHTR